MNRIRSRLLILVAASLALAPSLIAQQPVFEAKVPFQFSVGDRTLPAGEYRITRQNDFLHIQNRGEYSSALILTYIADSSKDDQVHLIFDRVDDLFFLRKIIAPASSGSIELAVSSAEKKANADQRRFASRTPSGVTTVAIVGAQ